MVKSPCEENEDKETHGLNPTRTMFKAHEEKTKRKRRERDTWFKSHEDVV